MKVVVCSLFIMAQNWVVTAQNIGLGTSTPRASSALEVSSTTGGLLIPRLTSAQRTAISKMASAPDTFSFPATILGWVPTVATTTAG